MQSDALNNQLRPKQKQIRHGDLHSTLYLVVILSFLSNAQSGISTKK